MSGRALKHSARGESCAWLVPFLILGALASAGWYLFRRFDRYSVEGRSMMPTLRDGDWVVVDLRAYRAEPRPGDVIVAHDPRDPARLLFKRVNHVDLHHRAWLLGDNVDESTDSRIFGGIHCDAIVGRVFWRYWPPARFGRVR